MDAFAEQIGFTLSLGFMVFVGSYFGIFKRNKTKLPGGELVGLFLFLWLLSAGLLMVFGALLSTLDQESMPAGINLLGPLVVGILVGRKIVSWRRQSHAAETEATSGSSGDSTKSTDGS